MENLRTRVATRCWSLALFSLTTAAIQATPVGAALTIPPTGLNPGDQCRLLFLTSGQRDAASTDIEVYNTFVQRHADASPVLAALGVNWKAVVSTSTVSARDTTETNPEVFGEGFPIYRVDGELVDRNYAALWNNERTPNLNITEFEEPFPFDPRISGIKVETWSGSLPDGTIADSESFMALGEKRPVTGSATISGHLGWTASRSDADSLHHIIGMSDLLTVAVLAPTTDFDGDGALTARDIDLLTDLIRSGGSNVAFDLNDDNVVDAIDRTFWVEQIANTFFGDANLDGTVNFTDFLALSASFDQSNGWAGGDFDGSGVSDFADFTILADNFGAARELSTVSEPSSQLFPPFALLVLLWPRRRSQRTS